MPGSIKDRVAIVGMGCTKFGERWDASADDLLVEAAYEAFEDAGIGPEDIQAAWVGTAKSGETGEMLSGPLKLPYLPITRLENACATASDAFRNGCYAIAAGIYDIVLAIGVDKFKDIGVGGLPPAGSSIPSHALASDSTYAAPANFAMLATTYFARYGLSFEEGKHMMARVSWKSHRNGALSPKAHFQREVSMETILNAPMVAWPLGLYDCCGVSDGAAAAIITTPEIAKGMRKDPIYVKALQIAVNQGDGKYNSKYDWTQVEATVRAAQAAYKEAGITDPRQEIDLAEVHDCFSITEAITMEDLGFSPRGKVRDDIESGFFDLDGQLPVQTDGGLKCFGHPIGASGLRMIYEVYKQLQGKAGPRQVNDAKVGLAMNKGLGNSISGVITKR